MRFQPRHYVLIVVIIGIFVFNMVRHHRREAALEGSNHAASPVITTPPAQTPAWSAFDHAASLRDAPEATYAPASDALHTALAAAPNDATTADIKGCITWLEAYRHGVTTTAGKGSWKDRSGRHIDGCVKYHLDTSL